MKNPITSLLPALALLLAAPAVGACTAPSANGLAAEPGTSAGAAVLQEGKRADLEHLNLGKSGLAISGYDPVSYFPEGGSKPRKGKAELSLTDRGVTWRFASKDNLERFKKEPAKYEPDYGGWCAFAMADGQKVEVDPKSYVIQGGRLMLFYKSFFNDTRKSWLKKPDELEGKANRAWSKIVEPPK